MSSSRMLTMVKVLTCRTQHALVHLVMCVHVREMCFNLP
jgi:hypothetical protein